MADIKPGDLVSKVGKPDLDWQEVLAVSQRAIWLLLPGNAERSVHYAVYQTPSGFPIGNYKVEVTREHLAALRLQGSQL